MRIIIVAQPKALETVQVVLYRAGYRVESHFPGSDNPDLQRYYHCDLPATDSGEDMAAWILEMLREIDGVEGAYIKPRTELADWKVVE
jgi:hypothetical protein